MTIPKIPGIYLVAAFVAVSVAVGLFATCGHSDPKALTVAHEKTVAATVAAAQQDTVFRVDTVERRVLVKVAQASRAVALAHLTDTALVKIAFRNDSVSEASSDSTIGQAARTLNAHVVLESALRTELRESERLRVPRYRVSTEGGYDVDGQTPVSGAEIEVRVSGNWSLVGRIDRRWAVGEGTRRQVLVRYSVGR